MIEVNNLTATLANEKFLKKIAGNVLEKEYKKEFELSIALIGKGRMRKLNKKYLRKNRVTDVLAFPEPTDFLGKTEKIQGVNILGEIVICLCEVKKNAKKFNLPFEKELSRVLIHGILHLLGYDHEKSPREAKRMEEKEDYYLEQLF